MSETRKYNYKAALLLADLVAFVLAFLAAAVVRYHLNPGWFTPGQPPWREIATAMPYGLLVWAVAARFSGLYRLGIGPVDELVRLLRAVVITFLALGAATFFYREFSYSRAMVLLAVPGVLVGTVAFRAVVRFVWDAVLRLDPLQGHALVVGTGPIARHMAAALQGSRSECQVRGLVSLAEDETVEPIEGVATVGSLGDLPDLLRGGRYQMVIVADGRLDHRQQLEIAEQCLRYGCRYQVVPDVFELMLDRVRVDVAGGIPLLGLRSNNLTGVNAVLKRVFDLSGALLLLLAAGPLMIATALAIKLSSKGPVFFAQERLGIHGRPFRFLKFRSMHVDSDDAVHREYVRKWMANEAAEERGEEKTFKLTHDPRVFRFGAFIRKYSIDELPQLLNVLLGEMSLIGPRPPIPYEVEAYREWHRRRFEALPGITGLWQVSGRNNVSFDEMVQLDIEYIENWSLDLDLKIALRTAYVVFAGSAY